MDHGKRENKLRPRSYVINIHPTLRNTRPSHLGDVDVNAAVDGCSFPSRTGEDSIQARQMMRSNMHASPRMKGKRWSSNITTWWMLWWLGWTMWTAAETMTPINSTVQETVQARIVGGRPVQPQDKYPWMVLLGCAPPRQPTRISLYCGGTLIAPMHVLSAAHCNPQRVGCDPASATVVFRYANQRDHKPTAHYVPASPKQQGR